MIADFENGADRLHFYNLLVNDISGVSIAGNNTQIVVLTLNADPANSITLHSAGVGINLTIDELVIF